MVHQTLWRKQTRSSFGQHNSHNGVTILCGTRLRKLSTKLKMLNQGHHNFCNLWLFKCVAVWSISMLGFWLHNCPSYSYRKDCNYTEQGDSIIVTLELSFQILFLRSCDLSGLLTCMRFVFLTHICSKYVFEHAHASSITITVLVTDKILLTSNHRIRIEEESLTL